MGDIFVDDRKATVCNQVSSEIRVQFGMPLIIQSSGCDKGLILNLPGKFGIHSASSIILRNQLRVYDTLRYHTLLQITPVAHFFHFDGIPVYLYTCIYCAMKTTVDLPEELVHQAKIVAAQHKTTLKALVLQGLTYAINHPNADSETTRTNGLKRALKEMQASNSAPMKPMQREAIHDR